MRGTWLALAVVISVARIAHAGHSIVVMSAPERVGALGSAMQVALAGRGVAIATLAAPTGELRLERAASAQRAALQLGADAALWIDADGSALDVCAVSSDGRAFRHAPLPPDVADATPRAFSAIATSLLDELSAPPEPAASLGIDVDVQVDGNGQAAVDRATPGFAPPAGAVTGAPGAIAVVVAAPRVPRTDNTLVEIGPMLSPLTAGVEAEIAAPVSPKFRFGVIGGVSHTFTSDDIYVLNGGLELRDVAVIGSSNHFDVGPMVGFALVHDSGSSGSGWGTLVYGGARLSYTWEGATSGRSLSLIPIVASDGRDTIPAAYATMKWDIAL
jgi:hypothetical protein